MKDRNEKEMRRAAMFEEDGMGILHAALSLLGAEDRALARLSHDGRILAMTPAAEQLLGLSAGDVIFERMSGMHVPLLRDALERKERFSFTDHFGALRLYDVESFPTEEGALLLFTSQQRQSKLEAQVHRDMRNGLQSILVAGFPVGGEDAARYDVLGGEPELLSALQEEAPALAAALQEKAEARGAALQKEAQERYQQMRQAVLRIERSMIHAELLQAAPVTEARPIFVQGDLAALCREAAEAFRRESGVQTEVRARQRVPAVYDPDWMMSALTNLLTNASGADHIRVSLTQQDGKLLISVEDDGEQFPSAELYRLYNEWREPFRPEMYSGHGPLPWSGLGLPVVRMVAEQHGGCLLYEELEQGGVFRLSISDRLTAEPAEVRSAARPEKAASTLEIELSVL